MVVVEGGGDWLYPQRVKWCSLGRTEVEEVLLTRLQQEGSCQRLETIHTLTHMVANKHTQPERSVHAEQLKQA